MTLRPRRYIVRLNCFLCCLHHGTMTSYDVEFAYLVLPSRHFASAILADHEVLWPFNNLYLKKFLESYHVPLPRISSVNIIAVFFFVVGKHERKQAAFITDEASLITYRCFKQGTSELRKSQILDSLFHSEYN